MILKSLILGLVLFSGAMSVAYSQDEKAYNVSVGAGLGFKKNLRVNNRYENMDKRFLSKPLPIVHGSIGRFSLGPQGLSFTAWGKRFFNVSLFINKEGDRYQGDGMVPRKDSAFIGVGLKILSYGFNISKDINGRSKGVQASLSYGDFRKLSDKLFLRTGFSLDWHDDRYAEYYYGVRKTEALVGRNEYHLKNYFRPGISFSPMYKISEDVSLFSALSFKLLPKKVSSSPTMNGDRVEVGGILAVSYAL